MTVFYFKIKELILFMHLNTWKIAVKIIQLNITTEN